MIAPKIIHATLRATFFAVIVASAAPQAQGHGSFHEQAEALTAELRERPDDPALLLRFAALNLEHGDWQVTLVQLARVDAVSAGKVATDLLRGRALAAGGKFAAAREKLTAFLAAHPGSAAALMARARVCSELGDPQHAATDCAAAMAATPRPEPDAYFDLTNFLVAAGRGADAVRALDEGLAKLGPIPSLIGRAIDLELTLDRTDAALARSAARATTPATRAAHAAVLTRAGRTAEARAAWEALRAELAALPPLDRASHAMLRLAEQANQALAAGGNPRP